MDQTNTSRTLNPLWLVMLAALMAAVLTLCVRVAPPFEGDAYEYAEIALHWVTRGTMTERHLRNFNVPDMNPTHAAAQRANYYTVLVAPFAAVFRDSPWTIFLPGLAGFLFACWATFRAGRGLFDARAAWWAALLVILHPRFLYLTVQDPTPALWLAGLCLLSAWLFLDKKYLAAGALLGVAVFVKQSALALLPAFFFYVLLFERAELKKARLWLGLAACLALMAPFLFRNTMLFGNPLYTEEAAARQNFDPQTLRDGNLLETTFTLRDPAPRASGAQPFFLWKTLQLFDVNFKDVLFGADFIDYGSGFVSLLYFAALPFFLLGLWYGRGHPGVRLCGLVIFFFLLLVMLVVVPFEARYIFPVAPFGLLVAVYGVYETGHRHAWWAPRSVLLFILLTGSVFTLPFLALHLASGSRGVAGEYIAACRFLKQTTPEHTTIMAWPPFASTFYSDRETVPLPYGGLAQIRDGITRYEADYLLYTDLTGTDVPPDVDFLRPMARGRSVTLYQIDKTQPGFRQFDRRYDVIREAFDPLREINALLPRVPFRMDWFLEDYLRRLPLGWIAAAFLFAVFLHQFVAWRNKTGARRAVAWVTLVIFCVVFRFVWIGTAISRSGFKQAFEPEIINREQLRATVGGHVNSLFVTGDKTWKQWMDQDFGKGFSCRTWEDGFDADAYTKTCVPATGSDPTRTAWAVVMDDRTPLNTPADVAVWPAHAMKAILRVRPVLEQARRAGFVAVRIGGGFVLRPAQDYGVGARPVAAPLPHVYTAHSLKVE